MKTLAKFDSGERIEPSIYLSDGSRPLDKEAGGWGGGRSQNNFFSALRALVWSKNKGGGGRALRASPLDPPLYDSPTVPEQVFII